MKAKKLVLAIAIFGGVLFTVQATNLVDLHGQTTTKMDKPRVKLPGNE